MVVTWIRLRQMKKLKETKPNGQFTRKNSKLLLIKFLIIIKIIKMVLTIKVIVIITIIIIIITKYRGRYIMPTTTNIETLQNGRKPLSNIKKSSPQLL